MFYANEQKGVTSTSEVEISILFASLYKIISLIV